MFNIDASTAAPQQGGSVIRPQKAEDVTVAQLAKQPPTQAESPEQAVMPAQSGTDSQSLRAREEEVRELVERINERLDVADSYSSTQVRFSVDDRVDDLVVSVIDRQTEQVVRQIPAEDVLDRLSRMEDFKGLLVDARS